MTFLFVDLTIIHELAASSDSTLQNSLEKEQLQIAAFPNGFEVYSYSFILVICTLIFLIVENDTLVGIRISMPTNQNTLCWLLDETNTRYFLLIDTTSGLIISKSNLLHIY